MGWLKSHKPLLGFVAAFVLIVGVTGFALSRGYLMRFVVNDSDITRDEYYRNAYDTSPERMPMYCTSGATLGFVYLWEVRCYSTHEALDAYMSPQSGSS